MPEQTATSPADAAPVIGKHLTACADEYLADRPPPGTSTTLYDGWLPPDPTLGELQRWARRAGLRVEARLEADRPGEPGDVDNAGDEVSRETADLVDMWLSSPGSSAAITARFPGLAHALNSLCTAWNRRSVVAVGDGAPETAPGMVVDGDILHDAVLNACPRFISDDAAIDIAEAALDNAQRAGMTVLIGPSGTPRDAPDDGQIPRPVHTATTAGGVL